MDDKRRYLFPRQVVAQNELLAGIGPMEGGLILAGLLLGFGVQWAIGLLGRVAGIPATPVVVVRVIVGVILGGSGWVVSRPVVGGSLLDYLRAMVRFRRKGDVPHLWGPPDE